MFNYMAHSKDCLFHTNLNILLNLSFTAIVQIVHKAFREIHSLVQPVEANGSKN